MKRFPVHFKYFVVFMLLCLFFVTCSKNRTWWDIDFEGEPRSGKAPLSVKFTDKSNLFIVQWDWEFPGATPDKARGQGPHTVQYKKPGQYDVTLSVYYMVEGDSVPHQDSNTKWEYIRVNKTD
ncbi:MAG: hypothetical protein PVH88_00930 [Ignavibacteria bacterium]|jgi:PKD repeat protein